jgi:hypothetical protein
MPIYGEDPVIPTTLDEKFSLLMQYLRSRRCLLILDNVEIILHSEQVGLWRKGYEAYGQILRTIGDTPHKSCLLLTSREKPREMGLMEGEQGVVRSLPLSGLTSDDGRAIFRQKGEFTASEAEWHISLVAVLTKPSVFGTCKPESVCGFCRVTLAEFLRWHSIPTVNS